MKSTAFHWFETWAPWAWIYIGMAFKICTDLKAIGAAAACANTAFIDRVAIMVTLIVL